MAGKKNRKFGRNAKRSPAMARYRAEGRAAVNANKRVKKHLKSIKDPKKRAEYESRVGKPADYSKTELRIMGHKAGDVLKVLADLI